MRKLLNWLSDYWLTFAAAFLLVFLPLYPKWPLFDVLPGYNVRVRLEDIVILFVNLIFWTQVLLKKIKIKRAPLLKPMLIYLGIGFLSTLSAIFITKTVYPEWIQIAKLYLHWVRRIEYFSLFFIFFFAVKNKLQLQRFLLILGVSVLGVAIYGFGQKYLYWPAYSTMNREFAKGIALYLTEHARVLSTFGGHFDLAAWVMITIIPLIVFGLLHPSRWWRLAALSLAGVEYWLLILSASRISWIAYMAGLIAVFGLLLKKKPQLWVWTRGLAVILISTVVMMSFGDLSERFGHIFKLQGVKDLLMRPFTNPPKNGLPLAMDLTPEQQLALVATQTDVPPRPGPAFAGQARRGFNFHAWFICRSHFQLLRPGTFGGNDFERFNPGIGGQFAGRRGLCFGHGHPLIFGLGLYRPQENLGKTDHETANYNSGFSRQNLPDFCFQYYRRHYFWTDRYLDALFNFNRTLGHA